MTDQATPDATPQADSDAVVAPVERQLGPAVPDNVLAYLYAYGDSRADDAGHSGLRIAEAILALRRWAAGLQAAERERCARLAVDAALAAVRRYEYDPAPVQQPYANNRLLHVGWSAADAIRGA